MKERLFRFWKRQPVWVKTCWALVGLVLFLSCLGKYLARDIDDFFAYYRAGERWLSGESPYQVERDYAFKYPPFSLFFFAPFSLLPYSVARAVYTLLHFLMALWIPWRIWKSYSRRVDFRKTTLVFLISFLASLRFIDGEYQVSQFGLFLGALMLWGASIKASRGQTFSSHLLFLAGALVKFHSLAAAFPRFVSGAWKRISFYAAFGLILFFPWPMYWQAWFFQMTETTPMFAMETNAYNFQGFYPFAKWFLGMDPHTLKPFLLAIPFYLLLLVLCWRRRVDFAENPLLEAHASFQFVVLGFLASPLPWQYTYSILWISLPLLFLNLDRVQQRVAALFCIILALSPKGIIGVEVSRFFEGFQGVFLCILVLWVIGLLPLTQRFLPKKLIS